MYHYLLLKFEPGFFSDEIFSLAVDTFAEIKSALPGVKDVQVYRNCSNCNSNADLLIRMELAKQEDLELYLEHPLHRSFVEQVNPHVMQKATFDMAQMINGVNQ